jgi:hypothetical protein
MLSITLAMIGTITVERALREQTERQADENARLVRSLRERKPPGEALSAIEGSISAARSAGRDPRHHHRRGPPPARRGRRHPPPDRRDLPDELLLVSAAGLGRRDRDEFFRVPLSAATTSVRRLIGER